MVQEPEDYWVGHSVSVGEAGRTTNPLQRRLIIDYPTSGTNLAFGGPAFSPLHPIRDLLARIQYDLNYRLEVLEVPAFEDQRVTFRYGIYRADVDTDKIGPIISNATPSKGAVVQDGEVLFQADVIDVSSGFTDERDDMRDTPDAEGATGRGRCDRMLAALTC